MECKELRKSIKMRGFKTLTVAKLHHWYQRWPGFSGCQKVNRIGAYSGWGLRTDSLWCSSGGKAMGRWVSDNEYKVVLAEELGQKKRVLFLTRYRRFCGKKRTFRSRLDIIWLKFKIEKVFEIGVDLSFKEYEKNQQELKYKNKLPGTKEKERI